MCVCVCVCVCVCTLACFSFFPFPLIAWNHDLSLQVTSAPYVELGWPSVHELVLVYSLSVIPELPHNCKSRDPSFLLQHTSSLGFQRPHSVQKCLEEKGQVEVTPRSVAQGPWPLSGSSSWGLMAERQSWGKYLILVVVKEPVGQCYLQCRGLSIRLAGPCLLKALLPLHCFTKLRLYRFWLQRSRALKAERSGVRGVSEHLCWVLWDNSKMKRCPHPRSHLHGSARAHRGRHYSLFLP